MRIVVGIATAGRPAAASALIELLLQQDRPADAIVVAPASTDDVPAACRLLPIHVADGERGLTKQRNAVLRHPEASRADVVVFFDDDFIPHRGYLAAIERFFQVHGDVAIASGTVLLDGARGPGVAENEAARRLAAWNAAGGPSAQRRAGHIYGCNMALSLQHCGVLSFDERLPLYGWLEDLDFSRRAKAYGAIAIAPEAVGVHLGMKAGRVSGRSFGYAQVVNPLYLAGKGVLNLGEALALIAKAIGVNAVKSVFPESFIDRRGRLRGNLHALADLLKADARPESAGVL
jgi:GT2 family glycosyltransferase